MKTVEKKSDIIFASLPPFSDFIARLLKKFGCNVFYISLSGSGQGPELEALRVDRLRKVGIVPLPLESLSHMKEILRCIIDAQNKLQKKTNQFVSPKLLNTFKNLYPKNTDIVSKLFMVVQSIISGQASLIDRVNCWADAYPARKHVLINFDVKGLLTFGLASNVTLFTIPMNPLFKSVSRTVGFFRRCLQFFKHKNDSKTDITISSADLSNTSSSRVVFVTHKGVDYGNLFQKTLFYSDEIDSELHSDNLLHFDYSNFPSPSEKTKWVCLGSERQLFQTGFPHVLFAISRGIVSVRSFSQLIGLLLLSRFYAVFKAYSKKLEVYSSLKLALIDYEILCPKSLLLAFEAKKIKTVAVQERFMAGFYKSLGSILDTYLCGSEYMAEKIKKSSSYHVKDCLSVGQYKSDNLIKAKECSPPQILRAPLAQGCKIITALGFHTHMDWHTSQADPLLNWKAHRHFLENLIQLSKDISNVFIVLRYKMIDWVSPPVFAEVVQEIMSSKNMEISMDYEKNFFSYDLCAHSDLVLAKHTSLGDECLSVGIPVLFHEYSHNTQGLVADAFDYKPTRVMCFNYEELLERTKSILSGDTVTMSEYKHLQNVVFGDLGDGRVRERIHTHINSILEENS